MAFFLCHFFAQQPSAPNCVQAFIEQQLNVCSLTQKVINPNESQYWVQFVAQYDSLSIELGNSLGNAPQFGQIKLLQGNCTNSNSIEQLNNPSYNTAIDFNSNLTVGQTYFLCFENFVVSTEEKYYFDLCLTTPKDFEGFTLGFGFPCEDDLTYPCEPSIDEGTFEFCSDIYICENEDLLIDAALVNLGGVNTNYLNIVYTGNLNQINSIGTYQDQLIFNSNSTGTFNITDIGYIHSTINILGQPLSAPYIPAYYYNFDINVYNATNNTFTNDVQQCSNNYTHSFPTVACSELISLTLDGVVINTQDDFLLQNETLSSGTHQIIETYDTECGTLTIITNIEIEEELFSFTINECGVATFEYDNCEQNNALIGIDFGDGNTLPLQGYTLPFTYTYSYTNTSPVDYLFYIQNGNPAQGNIFEETGTIQPILPQGLNLNIPTLACDGVSVSIDEPNITFSTIEWSIGGVTAGIIGQGTETISPDWITFPFNPNGYTVTVTAIDQNGCEYQQEIDIAKCCTALPVKTNQDYGNIQENIFGEPIHDFPDASFTNSNLTANYDIASFNFSNNPTVSYINTPYTGTVLMSDIVNQLNLPYNLNNNGNSYYDLNTSDYIYINTDLIVDVNTHFDFAFNVRIAPNVKITIIDDNELFLNRTVWSQRCDEMWGGIIVEGEDATLRTVSFTWLFNAETAVTSNNGGRLILEQSKFIDNHVGVKMWDYTGVQTNRSILRNNLFSETQSEKLLKPYFLNERPDYAIMIFNNQGVKIGADQNISDRNHIERHQNGILVANSNVDIQGNLFTDISGVDEYATTYVGTQNKAIEIYGHPEIARLAIVNNNYFNGCDISIELNKNVTGAVRNNYIKYSKKRAIAYQYNNKRSVTIVNNDISSSIKDSWGIFCYQNTIETLINIDNNRINENTIQHFNTAGNVINNNKVIGGGILVDNFIFNKVPNTPRIFIEENEIYNPVHGIICRSVNNIQVNNNRITLYHSNNFFTNSGYQFNGIWLQNVHSSSIVENYVTSNISGNSIAEYNHTLMRGITNENSFNNFIFKNRLQKIPAGLVAFGANGNTQFNCNTMLFNTNGIYTVNADLADQGIAPSATLVEGQSAANKWFSNQGQWRTDGDLLNTMTYFRHPNNNQFSDPRNINFPWNDDNLQNTINSSCKIDVEGSSKPNVLSDAVHGPKLTRENAFGEIVNGATAYNDTIYAQALNRWKASVALFSLQSDSSYFLGDSTDVPYFNFVNACNGTTTDKICRTQAEISNADMAMAETENESYIPACMQDEYNQKVQRIFIQQENGVSLTATDTAYLEMVACLDPVLNGSGVYQARTLLGWAGNCNTNLSFKSNISQETVTSEIEELDLNVVLYPNPNNGAFNLVYALDNDAELIIYNMTGKKVGQKSLKATSNEVKITLESKPGIYIYSVIDKNGERKTGKFVVQ